MSDLTRLRELAALFRPKVTVPEAHDPDIEHIVDTVISKVTAKVSSEAALQELKDITENFKTQVRSVLSKTS